jgi:nascent polypeptide-associated complex subunit alpha
MAMDGLMNPANP